MNINAVGEAVLERFGEVVMLSCSLDFGSSGAPIFADVDGEPQIDPRFLPGADGAVRLPATHRASPMRRSPKSTPRAGKEGTGGTGFVL